MKVFGNKIIKIYKYMKYYIVYEFHVLIDFINKCL